MTITISNARLRERAQELMPGGVSSPVRAFGAVGGEPPFIVRGDGAKEILTVRRTSPTALQP